MWHKTGEKNHSIDVRMSTQRMANKWHRERERDGRTNAATQRRTLFTAQKVSHKRLPRSV